MQKQSIQWYEHPRTKSNMRQMPAPYDNIWIGSDPCDGFKKEDADSFDVFLNVSDSECAYFNPSRPGQFMHWSPVNECGNWGYKHFWFAKKVLDRHHDLGHKIYLHCHAGACRSPNTFIWWLTSRGHTLAEAILIEMKARVTPERLKELADDKPFWNYRGKHFVKEGNIPKHLNLLWEEMNKNPSYSMAGHMLALENIEKSTEILCEGIRKRHNHMKRWGFYYKLKRGLREAREWLERRRNGQVRITARGEYCSISETVPKKDKEAKLAEFKEKYENKSKIIID